MDILNNYSGEVWNKLYQVPITQHIQIQIQIMGVINKIHEHAAIIYPQIYKYETRVAEGRAVSPL